MKIRGVHCRSFATNSMDQARRRRHRPPVSPRLEPDDHFRPGREITRYQINDLTWGGERTAFVGLPVCSRSVGDQCTIRGVTVHITAPERAPSLPTKREATYFFAPPGPDAQQVVL